MYGAFLLACSLCLRSNLVVIVSVLFWWSRLDIFTTACNVCIGITFSLQVNMNGKVIQTHWFQIVYLSVGWVINMTHVSNCTHTYTILIYFIKIWIFHMGLVFSLAGAYSRASLWYCGVGASFGPVVYTLLCSVHVFVVVVVTAAAAAAVWIFVCLFVPSTIA